MTHRTFAALAVLAGWWRCGTMRGGERQSQDDTGEAAQGHCHARTVMVGERAADQRADPLGGGETGVG